MVQIIVLGWSLTKFKIQKVYHFRFEAKFFRNMKYNYRP